MRECTCVYFRVIAYMATLQGFAGPGFDSIYECKEAGYHFILSVRTCAVCCLEIRDDITDCRGAVCQQNRRRERTLYRQKQDVSVRCSETSHRKQNAALLPGLHSR